MPGKSDAVEWEISTSADKLISDYAGIDLFAVNSLSFDVYRILYRDAYIHKLMQTEKGQEMLHEAYLLKQTKPDRKELRKHFGEQVKK